VIRGEDNARVLLDLAGQRAQGIEVEACAHVVLRGFEVAGGDSSGIVVHNCHHCTIEGNVVNAFKAVGIRLRASNDNTVRGNICYHNDSGIYVGEGSTRNLIEANICAFGNQSSENADGIGSSDCEKNIYRFNVLIANNDDGLDMWTSKRNTIEWNFACANGDQQDGDGNGFKLGGKWRNRGPDDPWDGGEHIVRNNLSVWNQSTGFTDNSSSGNRYEGNVAFGDRNTGSYASVNHSPATAGEPIREKIRQRFQTLIEEGVMQPTIHRLPLAVGLIYELKIWPAADHEE
ncbi:MAG: right-handed parallel beta-helix repeat-containing protein, partial [Phycisphaerae bacterium]|nr:right-handed parallel beta-helix repeat-containing protein [Phycisphaerae bacterium]